MGTTGGHHGRLDGYDTAKVFGCRLYKWEGGRGCEWLRWWTHFGKWRAISTMVGMVGMVLELLRRTPIWRSQTHLVPSYSAWPVHACT